MGKKRATGRKKAGSRVSGSSLDSMSHLAERFAVLVQKAGHVLQSGSKAAQQGRRLWEQLRPSARAAEDASPDTVGADEATEDDIAAFLAELKQEQLWAVLDGVRTRCPEALRTWGLRQGEIEHYTRANGRPALGGLLLVATRQLDDEQVVALLQELERQKGPLVFTWAKDATMRADSES